MSKAIASRPISSLASRSKKLPAAVVKFFGLMDRFAETTIEIANAWKDLSEEDRKIVESKISGSSLRLLNRIQRAANGSLHPQLLINDTPGQKALSAQSMAVQKEALEKGIPYWNPLTQEETRMPVQDLSGADIHRVFVDGYGGFRPIEEQKKFIKKEERQRRLAKESGYELKASGTRGARRIIIEDEGRMRRGLTIKDLKDMLKLMGEDAQ